MGSIVVNLIIWLLKRSRLSIENRTKCINALLNKLNAIPFRDIIATDNSGKITLEDRTLTLEESKVIRESALSVLDSPAFKIVRDQTAFRAVIIGVHKGDTPEQVMFSKAAIWWGQQEKELLEFLAQQ